MQVKDQFSSGLADKYIYLYVDVRPSFGGENFLFSQFLPIIPGLPV